jgi:serine phosphatase RsbU (regulator of sigma subunit)
MSHTINHIRNEFQQLRGDPTLTMQERLARMEQLLGSLEDLFEQNQAYFDSILHTSILQKAMLPKEEYLRGLVSDYFLLYKPKEIIGGDFYWITFKENKLIIAIADCTGHGIPGAFLSILGISLLNQITNVDRILTANKILNRLRYHVVTLFHQKGEIGETKDGMDIGIIVVDKEKFTLEYSGANRLLWVARKDEMIEIKGDRMPIAINNMLDPFTRTYFEFTRFAKPFLEKQDELHSFTNHEVSLQNGDVLYMFSDGYADQFGQSTNKKFMSKNLKDLLFKYHDESMEKQKEILLKTFEKWKGNLEQVDDVLVVGLKFD